MTNFSLLLFGVGHGRLHGVKVTPAMLAVGLIASVLLAVLIFYVTWRKERHRDKGIFPPKTKFTRSNLMEAYIVAAGSLVVKDRLRMTGKLAYINGYLQRHFADVYEDFQDLYIDALQRPVTMRSLSYWFNLHLPDTAEREKLVYFLIGLAWYDGELNAKEQAAIRQLIAELKIDARSAEAHMNDHGRKKGPQTESRDTLRRKYEIVLGLDPGAGQELIKKVYRKLVMIYHPDKFMQETPEIRHAAEAKFREVNEAYEYLMQRS